MSNGDQKRIRMGGCVVEGCSAIEAVEDALKICEGGGPKQGYGERE